MKALLILIICYLIRANFALLLQEATKEPEIGFFLQITDIHLDGLYDIGSVANCKPMFQGITCCRSYDKVMPGEKKRSASIVGDINCDSSFFLVNESIKSASQEWDSLDFVLWTGDTPGHHVLDQSFKYNMRMISNISDLMRYYFPNIIVYACIGNHDSWPIDQLGAPPIDSPVTHALAKDWSYWLNEESLETVKYGGYYTQLIRPRLRIISLNTLFYDTDNIVIKWWTKIKKDHDIAGQWNWLNETLSAARKNQEIVWIIGHVFPGTTEATPEFTQKYINLTSQYQDVIHQQYWGHSHFDAIFLLEKEKKLFAHGYITPSIVPDTKNPAYRIFSYDRDSLEVLDFTDYYFDLEKGRKTGKVEYQPLFSAKKEYGLRNLTSAGWIDFYYRMEKDSSLQEKYAKNYYLGYDNHCDISCQKKLISEIIVE